MPRPHRTDVLSDDARLTSVCPTVAYIGRICCQAGPFSWEHPIALSFYIIIRWFCAASAECRASSDVAICRQSVCQAVGGL